MAINKQLIVSFYQAAAFLDDVRILYQQAAQVRAKVALYQAATDPAFNAAVNAVIPAADRQRLATLVSSVNALAAEMEANYADFINPG